jgi:hypothetical protein
MAGDLTYGALQTVQSDVAIYIAASKYIVFPQVIYNSASPSVVTGGDYVSVSLSFTGIGDGTNAPMVMSSSATV